MEQTGFGVVVSMSKIQSESKSQQKVWSARNEGRCGIYVKDTIWKQITTIDCFIIIYVCCGIYVKDTIWKQITTGAQLDHRASWLWYLCQRYNLKANHNWSHGRVLPGKVVVSMSKIQSESKSQQGITKKDLEEGCGIYVKDTIWKQITTRIFNYKNIIKLWYLCQRYNLKANHNNKGEALQCIGVVVSMSKIQSESKSQPIDCFIAVYVCCGIYVKDTIWKQITTDDEDDITRLALWYLCQRYNLKANHNKLGDPVNASTVVVSMSKIQSESKSQHSSGSWAPSGSCGIYVKDTIWKQITTKNYFH